MTDANFGLRRLMDDLDSGNSTLPGDAPTLGGCDSDCDAASAIRMLDAVVNENWDNNSTVNNNNNNDKAQPQGGATPSPSRKAVRNTFQQI